MKKRSFLVAALIATLSSQNLESLNRVLASLREVQKAL